MAPHAVFVYELWNELNILFNQDELHHALLLTFQNHSTDVKFCVNILVVRTRLLAGSVSFLDSQQDGDQSVINDYLCRHHSTAKILCKNIVPHHE